MSEENVNGSQFLELIFFDYVNYIFTYLSCYRGDHSDHDDSEHEVRACLLQYSLSNSDWGVTCMSNNNGMYFVWIMFELVRQNS